MSAYIINYKKEADGKNHKIMTAVTSRAEYLAYRNTNAQQCNVRQARAGNKSAKMRLVQMNYSLSPTLPERAGEPILLKGCTQVSATLGMDVDLNRENYGSEEDYKKALAEIPDKVLSKKEELGLLMLERSATKGYHIVFRRRFTDGLADDRVLENQVQNLRWASDLLGVEYDDGAKDITRVFFTTTASPEDLLYLDDALFESAAAEQSAEGATERCLEGTTKRSDSNRVHGSEADVCPDRTTTNSKCLRGTTSGRASEQGTAFQAGVESGGANPAASSPTSSTQPVTQIVPSRHNAASYLGIPYESIIAKWWELYNDGQTPVKSNRNVLSYELAVNLRHICGFDRHLLAEVIPAYDGFSETEKMACIDSALSTKMTQMPRRLRDVLTELKKDNVDNDEVFTAIEEAEQEDDLYYYRRIPKGALPQGISESVRACGETMTMPVLAAICPMVGALATDVEIEIHGKATRLNMHSFVVGDAASGKGSLDDVVEAWMVEQLALNQLYFQQEAEFRAKKKAAKNKKEQPDEPHLPVRYLTMNNTVANLAERLANCDGKHAFSFTPEADTVAAKWRSSMSDFSIMLRQAYDGTRYDREAKSADATTVHIDHLLWNVCMCGTPDALYRVISNYTDGLLSRFIIAHTPDNTFAPLDDRPRLMTDVLREKIAQVAHLLPFMQGTLRLPKLEARSREWVERVRREALKDDDRVKARARLRDHGTAVRMTACLILCAVAERLIKQHGLAGAEKQLKMHPALTVEMTTKLQTSSMLEAYEVMAECLIDNDMLYFRDKLETVQAVPAASGARAIRGKNDRIYDRLSDAFTFEQAMGAKGDGCTHNSVRQMLKNWRKQGLVILLDDGRYQKVQPIGGK